MKDRCLSYTVVAVLLYGFLFCGTHHSAAQVVHAYRKPSEADLQWLFRESSAPPSDIVQVGFQTSSEGKSALPCEPCKPARSPKQSIPPAPQVIGNKTTTGLATEVDGVVNITPVVIDSATPIVQMSGERLPPPSTLPTETNTAIFPMDSFVERLPIPTDWDHLTLPDETTCHSYKNHKNKKTAFSVPDRIGSSAWLAGCVIRVDKTYFTLPNLLLSRPNVGEHFNAEVKNRIWADYRHWNNAVSIDDDGMFESRAVDQFSFGLEKQLMRRTSLELRVPLFAQFSSHQTANERKTAVELGNVSAFLKHVLVKNSRWTIASGFGATFPTAEDWRGPGGVRLHNNLYSLTPFLGVQWHPNKELFGHFVVQTDLPLEKNELVFGTERLKVEGPQVIRTGLQLGRWIIRNDCSKRACRLGSVVEVDYAVVTKGTPQYGDNNVSVSAWKARQSTLTAAVGMPMMFGNLTCTNAILLPISGGERAFSVGYHFSMVRQF